MKTTFRTYWLVFVAILLTLLLVACTPSESDEGQETVIDPPAAASESPEDDDEQDDDSATIQFTGVVSSVNGTVIIVNGLSVQTEGANFSGTLAEGTTVRVEGILQPDATVVAVIIVIITTPEATPEATSPAEGTAEPEETPNPEATAPADDDGMVIIVIEGPVEAININIITIYGINIILEPNDPLLTVIQIGDVIRVEGAFDDDNDGLTIVIVAITIIFIDIDVFVLDGEVWRDAGNCNNPPPPWAPANGWRRRCESSGGTGGGGRGSGRGSRRS